MTVFISDCPQGPGGLSPSDSTSLLTPSNPPVPSQFFVFLNFFFTKTNKQPHLLILRPPF